MTKLQTIQAELITAYEAISLPNSLGTPTGYKHEPEGGFDSDDLPAVVVTRGVLINRETLSSDRDLVTREYITDLYCYVLDASDPVNATNRDNTSDTVEAVETAFGVHNLTTRGVLYHSIDADTGDTELFARDDTTNYIGVRFRHRITYIQEK